MPSVAEKLKAEQVGNDTGERPKSKRTPVNGEFRIFDAANGVDTIAILDRLNIAYETTPRGEMATCPGCGEHDNLICKEGGLKCQHDRCAQAGPPAFRGFRTNVDLVMLVKSLDKTAAAKLICEWFNIAMPKGTKKTAAEALPSGQNEQDDAGEPSRSAAYESSGMDGESSPPLEEPTAAEPLRGLEYLGKVALVGRNRILELAATPVEYVWVDIAVAGTIVLIAGPPAEGKTTLLFLILAARMNPGEIVMLLGRAIQPAPPGQWVVLIEGEHSEASTGRKLVKSLKLLGLDDAALDRVVIVARKAVRLGSPEWSDVVRMVRAGLVSDIAIDTVARVAPADADNEREQVAVFDAVAQAIEAGPNGAPKPIVWAVAHTRKANNGELADVSGSAQRTGQADTVLLIKGEKVDGQTVSTKVTFAKLREDPDDYPLPVTFAIEKADDGELRISNADGKTTTDDRPLEIRTTELLEGGPKTKNALKAALGRNTEQVEATISNLFASRQIETTDVTVGGRTFKGFRLRRAPD